jgi:hypothetical protein
VLDENLWTGFNAYWNGIGAGTGEAIEQVTKNTGGRFGSPAANIAAFQSFEANVVQAIIDSDRNPTPETVTQIENQGMQILFQIIGGNGRADLRDITSQGIDTPTLPSCRVGLLGAASSKKMSRSADPVASIQSLRNELFSSTIIKKGMKKRKGRVLHDYSVTGGKRRVEEAR